MLFVTTSLAETRIDGGLIEKYHRIQTKTFRLSDVTPSIDIYDTSCTDADINAQRLIAATDTGSGTEDVDVTDSTMVAGVMTPYFTVDADGVLTIASIGTSLQLDTLDTLIFSLDAAAEEIQFNQTSVTGAEGIPMIFINDDRTGATANSNDEAAIVIDADGTTALYILDGRFVMGDDANWLDQKGLFFGTGFDFSMKWDTNGTGDDLFVITSNKAAGGDTNAFWMSRSISPNNMTDHDDYLSPSWVMTNDEGADSNDYSAVVIGARTTADVAVTHYFDFYAMTGAADGSVDATTTELAPIFRFGNAGTATTGHSITAGGVLFEDDIEVDGTAYFDGTVGVGIAPVAGTRITLPIENDAVTPTMAFGAGADGFYQSGANEILVAVGGVLHWQFGTGTFAAKNSNGGALRDSATSGTNPGMIPGLNDPDTGIGRAAVDQLSLIAGGVEGIRLTENGGVIRAYQVTAGITASTTQTQGQGALTSSTNEVSTVANANDTVTLPSATAGMVVEIINNGANTLQIFPASGDDLGAGVDTATTLAAGNNVRYVAYDSTNWES